MTAAALWWENHNWGHLTNIPEGWRHRKDQYILFWKHESERSTNSLLSHQFYCRWIICWFVSGSKQSQRFRFWLEFQPFQSWFITSAMGSTPVSRMRFLQIGHKPWNVTLYRHVLVRMHSNQIVFCITFTMTNKNNVTSTLTEWAESMQLALSESIVS